MFTGLIEELGRVVLSRPRGGGRLLTIDAPALAAELTRGESVAVNGACQTVEEIEGLRFSFFSMGETLRATTLGELRAGDAVNLERALTPTSRLGGHFVTGHVDGVGSIAGIQDEGEWRRIDLRLSPSLMAGLLPKGSIAVDGISLTLGPELSEGGGTVFIIPHSLAHTTLGSARVGNRINIETDILGKYVQRFLARGDGKDADARLYALLAEQGFAPEERKKR